MSATAPRPVGVLGRPDPAADRRLLCFPYSGCGASMYHRWPQSLGSTEIVRIQPPGRENRIREAHYGGYADLAESLLTSLTPVLDVPWAVFGHCGGALAAYEFARAAAHAGLPAERVFVSSQVAPHDGPYGRFLSLQGEELKDELIQLIQAQGGEAHEDFLDFSVALLDQDLESNRTYHRPLEQAPCPVTVISWDRDREIPRSLVNGWDAMHDDVRQVTLPGLHYEFLGAPKPLLDLLSSPWTG